MIDKRHNSTTPPDLAGGGVATTYRGGGSDDSMPRPSNALQSPAPRRLRLVTGSLRERWRTEVIRSPYITDSTRVLLLVLAEDMREDGYVSVPRERLAARLDRTERKVSQRLADAVDARLLDRVVRGQKGRTAVYRALLRVPGTSTLSEFQGDGLKHPERAEDAGNRHPESGFRVPHGGPTSSKAHPTQTFDARPSVVSPTSELLSENDEVHAGHSGARADSDVVRKAHDSWGISLRDAS